MTAHSSRRALRELDAIFAHIARDNPRAASELVERIETRVALLTEQPHSGRPGRVEGTRELVVAGTAYILPYRVRDGRVEILAALHASRDRPERF